MSTINPQVGSQAGFIRRKWNWVKNAVKNCNPKDLVTKVAPRVALSATALSFGMAGMASISSNSPSTSLSVMTGLFGAGFIAGGAIRALVTDEKVSNKEITAEAGRRGFVKSLGELLTGSGLAGVAMGTGFVSFIPLIAGIALNGVASIVPLKKE